MADLKDKIIGGFRVLREIQAGSGSQGTVYKAICVDAKDQIVPTGTIVALKVMAVQDEGREQWRKLQKRTDELARMDCPHVVKYHGCFSEAGLFNDIHVVVQEFLQGETLKERLTHFPSGLDVDEALKIADAALMGLTYVSGCGIIHRDIKPGNIFLCDDGSVKLIDFEIAKKDGGTTTSSAGNIRGSFDYMAPDFTDANFHGDIKSDVFSMGVVFHEMLTGKTPYQRLDGDSKQANFAFLSRWAHSLSDGYNPIRISSRINRLLAHTEDVMARSLAPQRENRYEDFEAFRNGIKAIRFRNLRNGQNVYQMLQFIGKGGFGEVFKARMRNTGKLVAVKHLLKADYAERFYREAKIMKKLHNPCFVQLVDFFVMDGGSNREAFLVMAFLDGMPGSSLRDAIKGAQDGRLPALDVYKAFERYAKGLRVMHAEGIYHRDIKPSNLYFPVGRPESAAIMDLGIARDVNGTATHGQVPGTLDYMPPEVVVTDNRGDGGMDIYALGLCFYEALTSKTAFPRLPTGTATYAAFFDRAKSKRKPTFDDDVISADRELISLLTDMTNPDLSLRIRDAGTLVARIHELRRMRFPEAERDQALADEAGSPFDGIGETIAADGATQGTIFAQWGKDKLEALEQEQHRAKSQKNKLQAKPARIKFLLAAFAAIGIAVIAGLAWRPARIHCAESQLTELLNAYHAGNTDLGMRMESVWRAQWNPNSHNWLKLNGDDYAKLAARLDSEKQPQPTADKPSENARRMANERQETLEKIAGCIMPNGKLNEEKFLGLERWKIPEELKSDDEINRRLGALGQCLSSAITEKLSVEPPLTRQERIRRAWQLLENLWAENVLSLDEREQLQKKITDVSSWCVGIVKNNCETDIRLDNRVIAVGSSSVAVYRDGHSEIGVISKMGCHPIHLPPKSKLDGRIYDVHEGLFSKTPVISEPPHTDRATDTMQAHEPAPKNDTQSPAPTKASNPSLNESLQELSDDIADRCRGLMAFEPIESRQDRLVEALKILTTAVAVDRIMPETDARPIENEIKQRQRWAVGKIKNGCHDVTLTVYDQTIEPGKEKIFVLKNGIPTNWYGIAPGYKKIMLPRDFDGRTITLDEDNLQKEEARLPPASITNVLTNKKNIEIKRDTDGFEFFPNPPTRAAGDRISLRIPNGPLVAFVWCPPGRFLMGSPDSEKSREGGELQHLVTLTNGFWIGEKEVTREQWKSVMTNARWTVSSLFGNDNLYPIEDVTWKECCEFCQRFGRAVKRTVRLPTEAEWEYACRAGTSTPFSFGSSLNGSRACCKGKMEPYGPSVPGAQDYSGTELVGSFQQNPWGIYDMHGNVYEWCSDWYVKYTAEDATNPTGPSTGSSRVIRGGGWNSGAKFCRSAYRGRRPPTSKDIMTGFRLCLEDNADPDNPISRANRSKTTKQKGITK